MEKVEILTVIFAVAAFFLLLRASKIETPGRPLKPSTITRALSEATDQQITSENARRNARKRKIKSGGRNGGRPKRTESPN